MAELAFEQKQTPPIDLAHAREQLEQSEVLPEIEIARLLTEVDHISASVDEFGYVPEETKADILVNKQTALNELAMPYAVTQTAHKIERIRVPEEARTERIFSWLGRTAVGVAESGYEFHFSKQAAKRVDVEVAEARHAQETLAPGRMQFFISPRMSDADAPAYVAEAEHLHDDDSIRASYVITDSQGNESYRIMESLLVRDVPLDAWVAMLKDDTNIFGKSIPVEDENSSLSVMKTFNELELPVEQAPEGPVTLVEAVLPYISDAEVKTSVSRQLIKFRNDQGLYSKQAKILSEEWYESSSELEQSLRDGISTPVVTRFIDNVSQEWDETIQRRIENHRLEGSFIMTRELAAIVEKAKRNILATKAGVLTDNEAVIEQVDTETIQEIKTAASSGIWQQNNPDVADQLDRSIIKQEVEVGGGCSGNACGLKKFDKNDPDAVAAAKELGINIEDAEDQVVYYDKATCPECGGKGLFYNKDTADASCPNNKCGATVVAGKKYTKQTKNTSKDKSFLEKLFEKQNSVAKKQQEYTLAA